MLYTGKLLWNIRERYGVSRETLSEGLCSVSLLTHIENNKRDADKLLFESLYQRLGKYSGRFEKLLDSDEYKKLIKRWNICDAIDEGRYEAAQNMICEYRQEKHSNLEAQYMCLVECEVMHRTSVDISVCMDVLKSGIMKTRLNFDIENIKEYYLSRMEMLLIQQYVRYIEMSGEEKRAVRLYKMILEILEQERYDRSERELLYRHVGYWLMQYYLRHDMHDEALEIGEKTYEYTINGDFIMFLAELKEGIIRCLEYRGEDVSKEKKYIDVLKEFKKKYGVCNAEDFFPRYEEINAYNVNDIISQRRKMLGMSQEELSFEICDISTVSLMENNHRRLQKEKKEKLLQKVNLSGDKYVASVDTYDYTVFEKTNEIRDLCNNGQQKKIKAVLEMIQKEYRLDSINSKQFIFSMNDEYNAVQGDNSEDRLVQLKNMLSQSIGDIEKVDFNDVILLYNEWALLYKIILWYKINKRYDDCMEYFTPIIETYNESRINNNAFTYIQVNSIAGDVLGEMKDVDKAELLLQKAVDISVRKDMLSHIRFCFYVMVWNLLVEKENISKQEREQSKEYLRLAYVFAKIYKNDDAINRTLRLAERYSIDLKFN